ncbi:Osmotin, thaumatin-like protein, partial [Meredithblackwellia eburnea MCA 4105]
FIFVNKCPETIWPAITTYITSVTNYTGTRGWEQKTGESKTVSVPSTWNGRTWGRRECSFDCNGNGKCTSGDATVIHEKLGEFNLNSNNGGLDYWDISAVPGFNLPVTIQPDGSCTAVQCTKDINPTCPDDRMKVKAGDGTIIGCLSACNAKIDAGDNSINCCSGTYANKETCDQTKVYEYDYFKAGCEHACFDDKPQNTPVVFTCSASGDPSYTITFCP